MIKEQIEPGDIERKVHDLAKAINEIRASQAKFDDVVSESKHAKLSRLELLVEDLNFVIADIPKDCDWFEFALLRGEAPRLWIDMTTFVRLAGNGREYEFVKDTRKGRLVMGRDTSRKDIGARVTSYVAEKLLERERMLDADWVSHSQDIKEAPKEDAANEGDLRSRMRKQLTSDSDEDTNAPKASFVNSAKHSGLSLLVWFLLGLFGGGLILFALTWFGLMDKIVMMAR